MNVVTTKGKDSHCKADQKTSKLVSKIATGIVGENTKSLTCCEERNSSENCEPGFPIIRKPAPVIRKATRKVGSDASSRSKTIDVRKSNSTPNQRATDAILDTQNSNDSIRGQPIRQNLKVGCLDKSSTRQRNVDKLPALDDATSNNKNQKTVYDVDSMSSDDIRNSLSRISANPIEPFAFLTDVMNQKSTDESETQDAPDDTDLTDIDIQLASLVRRVKLNRILLERANKKVKDINVLTERSRMMSLRSLNHVEESFSKTLTAADGTTSVTPELPTISHPEMDELKKTMNSTIEMLDYVHNMTTGDLIAADLPPELMEILAESTPV